MSRCIGKPESFEKGSEKMQRSRMLTELRNLLRATRLARANRMALNEVVEQSVERPKRSHEPSRRRFVRDLGAVAGTGLLLNSLPVRAFGKRTPRIAIVGGGIAGLNAALTLQDAGLASTIYEASGLVGGRIHSNRSTWVENQTSEWCANSSTRGIARCKRWPLVLA
jgi:monoamine oxidase